MKENPKKMTVKMVKKDKNEDDFIVFLKSVTVPSGF